MKGLPIIVTTIRTQYADMSDLPNRLALDYGHADIHCDRVEICYTRVSTLHSVNTYLQEKKLQARCLKENLGLI